MIQALAIVERRKRLFFQIGKTLENFDCLKPQQFLIKVANVSMTNNKRHWTQQRYHFNEEKKPRLSCVMKCLDILF